MQSSRQPLPSSTATFEVELGSLSSTTTAEEAPFRKFIISQSFRGQPGYMPVTSLHCQHSQEDSSKMCHHEQAMALSAREFCDVLGE